MIDIFLKEKLIYKKGKNIFVNQNNASSFLEDQNIDIDKKINFLEHIIILEDYNAINILLKNYSFFSKDVQEQIIFLLNRIPFIKIENNLAKLINHRDLKTRASVLNAIKDFINPNLLQYIEPQLNSTSNEVRLAALTAYYTIMHNSLTNELSLMLSSEDEDLKKQAFKSLLKISDLSNSIDDLKNITFFDKELEKEIVKEDKDKSDDLNYNNIQNSLEKLEKNSNYSFISILTLSIFFLATSFYVFFRDTNNSVQHNNILSPKKITFAPETLLSEESKSKAFEALENGNLDSAEVFFEKLNDENIKNYNLFKINLRKKRFQKAAFYFLNLKEYSADNIEDYIYLVNNIEKSGEIDLSIQLAEKLIYFNSYKINSILLDLYKKTDIEKALVFNRIYALNDLDTIKKGAEYYQYKDYKKSSYYYNKLIDFSKTIEQKELYSEKLIQLMKKNKKDKELEAFVDSMLKKYDQSLLFLKYKRDLLLKEEFYVEALEIIQKLIDLEHSSLDKNSFDYIRYLYIIDKQKAKEFFENNKNSLSQETVKKINKIFSEN